MSNLNVANAQNSYTPIKQLQCIEKPTEFYLFYEGETIPFEYEKIGEVSSCQNSYAINDRALLNNLKYLAWENCANGLLFIKSGYIGTEGQKYYTAVAVRINMDANFVKTYGTGADMSFVDQVKRQRIANRKQQKAGLGIGLVGILLLVYLLTQLEY